MGSPAGKSDAAWWRLWRYAWRAGLGVWFVAVAIYFGPNVIMFHKLTRLSPRDFVDVVRTQCVPTVAAMKRYQRDHGRLPDRVEELVPDYLPARPGATIVADGQFIYIAQFNHEVTYRFTPGDEGWQVTGPFVNGPIPVPPVAIGPDTRPVTRPATRPDQ